MAYNPNILTDVLRARSLTPDQLSRRLKIEPSQLKRELGREPEPGQGILNKIAKELAVPSFTFFREKSPPLHDVIPDFRSPTAAPTTKSRETIQSIQFAEGVQKALSESDDIADKFPKFTATKLDEVDAFALQARQFFNITVEDQVQAKDAHAFYVICRKKIEDRGIIVLHDTFPEQDGSGYCIYNRDFPVIVINTMKQNKGRRLFTLIHELGHVLMGKTGISDPFVRNNIIERLCNRFAGAFLVPASFIAKLFKKKPGNDPNDDDVKWAANRLNISQEATALRLEQLGIYKPGSYDKWKALVHNRNPDFIVKRGGPGKEPPPQEKIKLAKYGFRFAKAFANLLEKGLITQINLYRSTGLKPKYQVSYFDYVKALTPSALQNLELDDG